MNTIREVQKINERELELGIAGTSASWHAQYSQSAWIYIGNVDHSLSEGDLLCVLSQFGEIEDLHLARHEDTTGKSKGFCFCKYEDARSCILAVDNLCGIQLCGRSLRIDHVENYRLPKHLAEKEEAVTKNLDLTQPGLAYVGKELANDFTLDKGQDLFAPPPPATKTTSTDKDNKIAKESKHDHDDQSSKEAKRRRKEERQWKRQEKEKRNRAKEQRQVDREERRRERRARRMRQSSRPDDSRERHDDDDGPEKKKKHKKKHHKHKKHRKHDDDRRSHHNTTSSSTSSDDVSA